MDRTSFASLGLVAAALIGAAPSAAESTASPYAVSASALQKSEALLGSPSKLAALLAKQGGTSLIQATAPLQPAHPPILRLPSSDQATRVTRSAIVQGSPDVFGSVALPVEATPLDRRWQAVVGRAGELEASRWAASLRGLPEADRIEAVNRFVNARITFDDDLRQFGRPDVWQGAAEALRRGRGDCEDYAIAKLQLLRAAGLREKDLFLVIVKDLVRRSDHAVLAVQSGGRMWVLDNGTDEVKDSADVRDYRPIFTYAASRRWTHGYRRLDEPPMLLAAATSPPGTSLPTPAAAPALVEAPHPTFTVSAATLDPGLLG